MKQIAGTELFSQKGTVNVGREFVAGVGCGFRVGMHRGRDRFYNIQCYGKNASFNYLKTVALLGFCPNEYIPRHSKHARRADWGSTLPPPAQLKPSLHTFTSAYMLHTLFKHKYSF